MLFLLVSSPALTLSEIGNASVFSTNLNYGKPNKRACIIQQNFLNAHGHCLHSEAKGILPSSLAKGSKLHIQNPAEDLQEFNRNNDSLSIKWLPGTKALYTSYSHCLNDAFRKKEKKKVICFIWTLQSPGFSFYSPILFPPRKRDCIKGKGFSVLELLVKFSSALVEFIPVNYHCLSSASYMIWYYFKLNTF